MKTSIVGLIGLLFVSAFAHAEQYQGSPQDFMALQQARQLVSNLYNLVSVDPSPANRAALQQAQGVLQGLQQADQALLMQGQQIARLQQQEMLEQSQGKHHRHHKGCKHHQNQQMNQNQFQPGQIYNPMMPNQMPPLNYPQNGYPQNGYPPGGYPQNAYPPNGYVPQNNAPIYFPPGAFGH